MATLNQSLSRKFLSALTQSPTGRYRVKSLVRLPGVWLRRAGQRQQLRREIGTDPERLRRLELDIGLPPGTLHREMTKPFWVA